MDINVILPIISFGIAGFAFYYARKKETQEDTSQSTEMMVELRKMREDVAEIKTDFKEMRNEMRADHDDIVTMKRDLSAMWERIDEIKLALGIKGKNVEA